MSKWISVKDRFPNKDGSFLVYEPILVGQQFNAKKQRNSLDATSR